MSKISLNDTVSIDLPKLLEGRMVILANSGGGKSWAIRRIAEQAVGQIQVIIIDPEGEFATLREKFDFILAGKDADVPVEVRSASLLATKLLEINKSAVIDLYELHPQERQRFVKNFCDGLVNCPKHLYHPVLIILDEAHDYVPEGKPSEATWAVEALSSKGRKRGQCLIPASQRVSKLSKNVSAECNTKLIGRASQDIDMKRAGDELGFTKDRLFELRQLKPGEFFAFGPAISDEVQKVKIGDVQTTHAKISYKKGSKTPPPSAVIKEVLASLADLPKEAERELTTAKELKSALAVARREATRLAGALEKNAPKLSEKEIRAMLRPMLNPIQAKIVEWREYAKKLESMINSSATQAKALRAPSDIPSEPIVRDATMSIKKTSVTKSYPLPPRQEYSGYAPKISFPVPAISEEIGVGERKILIAVASQPDGMTREHITVQTGYKRSTRDTYIQRLQQRGCVQVSSKIQATQEGIDSLGSDYEQLPQGQSLINHYLHTLPKGERDIFNHLVMVVAGEHVSREDLSEATGYKRSTRDTYLQRLSSRQLVQSDRLGFIRASPTLFL